MTKRATNTGKTASTALDPIKQSSLWSRPGFLIRRLHQIHISLFLEETARFDITPVQYSLMSALIEHPAMDQVSLAAQIGLDRTSVAEVLARLAARGLVKRTPSSADRRVKLVTLTPKGRAALDTMSDAALRAHSRTIAPLPGKERTEFLRMLMHLVNANNDVGRAPLQLGK